MSDQLQPDGAGISRRNLVLGAGAVAGAGAFVTMPGSPARAGASVDSGLHPEVLATPTAGLTYVGIDALAFFTASQTPPQGRYSDNISGTGSLQNNTYISAPLSLPAGSVVRQINVSYQGQPIVEIQKRPLTTPNPPAQLGLKSLDLSPGGAVTQTYNLATPVTIEVDSTYTLRFFLSAGSSIYGVTVGYLPPTQSFIAFAGPVPRVLDTREGAGKLAPGEERVIALGFPGARGAVINLTVTGTEGVGGFVAVFRADITWPGNSSINWSGPNQDTANSVITALDGAGQIKIRGGAAHTHVVIDRIGWLV